MKRLVSIGRGQWTRAEAGAKRGRLWCTCAEARPDYWRGKAPRPYSLGQHYRVRRERRAAVGVIGQKVWRSTRRLLAGSINNPKCLKKSTPRMGNYTAASKKGQLNALPLKDSCSSLSLQHGMGWPAASAKAGPWWGLADVWQKTEKAAPVSTKKQLLESWSVMRASCPGDMALTSPGAVHERAMPP